MLCCLEVVEGKDATKFCAWFLMFWEGRTVEDTVLAAPALFGDVVRFRILLNAELSVYSVLVSAISEKFYRRSAVFTDSVGQGCA